MISFGFDRTYGAFELLETEEGAPNGIGGFRDVREKERTGGRFDGSVKNTRELFGRLFNADINKDLIMRRFNIGGKREALIVYMNGMADDTKINDFILRPLMEYAGPGADLDELSANAVRIAEIKRTGSVKEVVLDVTEGMTALFAEGEAEALVMETRGYEKRGISPPENEKVVTGPNESFTESYRTNVTLIRRQLHIDDLVVESRTVGGGNVRLAIVYREGVTNRALIAEVKKRVAAIGRGGAVSGGTVAQQIEDQGNSPIPLILSTERPDRACSHILQGRVALLVEGSPCALIMPITLFSLLNSPEDVYLKKPLGTLVRLIRYFGAGLSVLLPGYFLALALYHQGLLSTEVLSTVIASRRMVFEPIGVEMILLLLIFQMIREAGQRVPGNIGQAIGIIGGLIMGQAAVAANLASSVVLIIIAASGLGNFCIPDYRTQLAASYLRIAVLIAAWLGGLLGITAVVLAAVCRLASLKSFGVPFLSPFAPKTAKKRPVVLRGDIEAYARPDDHANSSFDERLPEGSE